MLRGIAAIVCLLALTVAARAAPLFAQRLDLIERHQVTIEARVVGVTQVDELFWLAQQGDGIDPPRFLVVDELGTPQFTLPQTGTTTPAVASTTTPCTNVSSAPVSRTTISCISSVTCVNGNVC